MVFRAKFFKKLNIDFFCYYAVTNLNLSYFRKPWNLEAVNLAQPSMGFGPPMGKLASPRLNAVLRSRSTKVAKSALPLVRPIWGWRRLSLEVILLSGQIGHDMKSLAYGSDFWYVSYLRSRRSSTMLTWGPSSIYPLWGTNFVGFKQGLNNRKTTTYLWWLTPNKVQFFDSGMKKIFSGNSLQWFHYSASVFDLWLWNLPQNKYIKPLSTI